MTPNLEFLERDGVQPGSHADGPPPAGRHAPGRKSVGDSGGNSPSRSPSARRRGTAAQGTVKTGLEAPGSEPIRLPITGELDLHTFRPEDLGALIPAYLEECSAHGLRQVRIIHGKGTEIGRAHV